MRDTYLMSIIEESLNVLEVEIDTRVSLLDSYSTMYRPIDKLF
jgi:hypothetical protein